MDWDLIWGTLLGLGLLGFAVFETKAVLDRRAGRPGDTLSATLRRWLGVAPQHPRRWYLGGAFIALLAWFGVHILTPWL